VAGSLQSRQWTDRDGNKRTSWEVNVENSYFGESKREDRESYGGPSQSLRDSSPRRGASQGRGDLGYGNPNVSAGGFEDLGPGAGEDNPFVQSKQMGMEEEDDGELPF
jgi:single-strand DNA-binding protein